MNQNMLLILAAVFCVAACGVGFGVASHLAKRNEQTCINQMRWWYSAALSYSLEQNICSNRTFTLEELLPFVGRPGHDPRLCPSGKVPYAPFTVPNGPVCPKGHDMFPGEARPLKIDSTNKKVTGVYRMLGLTNLIREPGKE